MVCRILVADDSSTIQKVIRIGLAAIPTEIRSASSYVEATKVAEPNQFDLIIADAGLPGVSTASDFIRLQERAGQIPLVILMGSYDAVRESDLRSVGISHIVKKPFPPGELPQLVQQLVGRTTSPKVPAEPAPWTTPPPPAPATFSLTENAAEDVGDLRFSVTSTMSPGVPNFLLNQDAPTSNTIPPSPEVEPGRRGRPAFDLNAPAQPSVGGQSLTQSIAQSLAQSQSSPPPPIFVQTAPSAQSVSASALSTPALSMSGDSSSFQGLGPNGLPISVEIYLKDVLPSMVDRAVERYCHEHFKTIARDVLTTEIRRLAEEKARYLVDQ